MKAYNLWDHYQQKLKGPLLDQNVLSKSTSKWVLWCKIYFIRNIFWKFYEVRSKMGVSIDANSGPLRYVLWYCGSICHQLYTFIQIGESYCGALPFIWHLLINVEIPGMDLQKLIKMKSISQLCKSVERKQSKEPENMGLKTTTIFGLHLLTIWNISRHLKLVSIAPLISKLIHLIPIIATFILLLRITRLDPLH